ncbi:MAG TPA: cell division protein SepF, partial [Mycobacterium sp.]
MSTLHKVKAYFGMAPLEDYEDEYYDDDRAPARGYAHRGERYEDAYDGGTKVRYDRYPERGEGREYEGEGDYQSGYRGGYADDARYRGREFDRAAPRYAPLRGSTRGALAMDPRRMAMLFDESSPLSKITTLRPKDYSE